MSPISCLTRSRAVSTLSFMLSIVFPSSDSQSGATSLSQTTSSQHNRTCSLTNTPRYLLGADFQHKTKDNLFVRLSSLGLQFPTTKQYWCVCVYAYVCVCVCVTIELVCPSVRGAALVLDMGDRVSDDDNVITLGLDTQRLTSHCLFVLSAKEIWTGSEDTCVQGSTQ